MDRRTPLVLCASGVLLSLACAETSSRGARGCAALFGSSDRVEAASQSVFSRSRSALAAAWSEAPLPEEQLRCELERREPDGLRVRSARLNGRELSEARLALVNADLLLEEIRRAEP